MNQTLKLVSGDSHVLEPPDLWTKRLPAKYQDAAPKMQRFPQGDAWVMPGLSAPINFGMNAAATKHPKDVSPWITWEDAPRGGYDPEARLGEQDRDGVAAEVMYPTPRISSMMWTSVKDPQYHLALLRAYNDWLSEYCAYDPSRLVGEALMPNVGTTEAIAELDRSSKLKGMFGVNIGQYPHGGTDIGAEDDPFWAACAERGVPVAIHVGMAKEAPGDTHHKGFRVPGVLRWDDAPYRIMEFVFSGACERFPDLRMVMSEVDCGWVPYFMEQLDLQYDRKRYFHGLMDLKERPSWYVKRNFWYTFIIDRFGVQLRHEMGVDKLMWSNDYPHVILQWPHSWDMINERFAGVPEDEKQAILAGNAASLYRVKR